MTTAKIYRNINNPHKYLDVRSDGHYHSTVCQFMAWEGSDSVTGDLTINRLGDGRQHRINAKALRELLMDYTLMWVATEERRLAYIHTGRFTGYYKTIIRK